MKSLMLSAKININTELTYDPFDREQLSKDTPLYMDTRMFYLRNSNNDNNNFSSRETIIIYMAQQNSCLRVDGETNKLYLQILCKVVYDFKKYKYDYILKYSKDTIKKIIIDKLKPIFNNNLIKIEIDLTNEYVYFNWAKVKDRDIKTNYMIDNVIKNNITMKSFRLEDSIFYSIMGKFKQEIQLINKVKNKTFIGTPCIYILPINSSCVSILIKALFKKHLIYNTQVLNTMHSQTIDGNNIKYFIAAQYVNYEFIIDRPISESGSLFYSDSLSKDDIKNIIDNFKTSLSKHGTIIFETDDYYSAQLIISIANDLKVHIKNLVPDKLSEKKDIDNYVKLLAKDDGIEIDTSFISNGIYTWQELDSIYYEYKSNYIYNKLNFGEDAKPIKKVSQYDSMKTIDDLIGLGEIKKVLKDILSYNKMQSVLSNRGISKEESCKHMVFYGNPGTAKTTVARIFGKILKENNVLTKDVFKEVSRNDLISQYLGGTASKTHMVINEAKGGILFIDEAYSLNDKWYGRECIDTLVQELDNIRKDTIVIFAGYPDKMKEFFEMNPGLKSRIAFHVNFPNYSKEELLEIAKLIAKSKHMSLSDDALNNIGKQINLHIHDKDFGNGRFIRNIIEQSMMKQSTRIISTTSSYEKIKDEELTKLEGDDIAQVQQLDSGVKIGF